MLQQTQVERVIPKYRAFLKRWPTVRRLAAASRADVIRAWSGLGYNRRAVNLHRAAQAIVARHGGQIPRSVSGLKLLPGLGHYTSRAVAAFAFLSRDAFIDTNIRRILGRIFLNKHFPTVADDQRLLKIAATLVPSQTPDLWHHGLMDLGALICKPAPLCGICPLKTLCRSYPAILKQPQAKPRRLSVAFEGSDRFWRGIIVRLLTNQNAGLTVQELHRQIQGVGSLSRLRFQNLLNALKREGLIGQRGSVYRLGD